MFETKPNDLIQKLSFWNFKHAQSERAGTKQWGELKNFWSFIPL